MQSPSPIAVVTGREYTLSDDLAKLSLPQTFADETRKLAYVNSICLLFLLIGAIGLNPPRIIERPLTPPVDVVPVIFTPPEEQPPPPEQPPDQPEQPPDAPLEAPQVVTVVAPNTPNVAFAIPVEGAVVVASSPRYASPPPGNRAAPPVKRFSADAEVGGRFPDPPFPREELLSRHQGNVMLYVIVGPDGIPSSVTVKDGSGYGTLDRHAMQWVKSRWVFLPGETRHYLVPIVFRIQ